MSAITDSDLKELKDLMIQEFKEIKQENSEIKSSISQLSKQITELQIAQAKVETRLEDWKPSIDKLVDLSEKVG